MIEERRKSEVGKRFAFRWLTITCWHLCDISHLSLGQSGDVKQNEGRLLKQKISCRVLLSPIYTHAVIGSLDKQTHISASSL